MKKIKGSPSPLTAGKARNLAFDMFGEMRYSTFKEQQIYQKMLNKYSTVIEGVNIFNMSDIEVDYCDICHKRTQIQRQYYYYDINCECCGGNHFQVVRYCKDCKPEPPLWISAQVKPLPKSKGRFNPENWEYYV